MKLHQLFYILLSFVTAIHALALPTSFEALSEASRDLFKRKGGGGGGGGGGGARGGSSSSSSSSSSSGSSGSRSGSSSSSGGTSSGSSSSSGGSRSGSSGSSSSSSGGTRSSPSYGGGGYYGGGAATPYRSGTSRGGVAPFLIGGAALGALAVLPGIWLYGAYAYNYNRPYYYHNDTSNRNESHPITCLCGRYEQCGCDDNNNTDYVTAVANNASIARVANVNGTDRLIINGTLSNDSSSDSSSNTGAAAHNVIGYWPVVAGVVYTVLFI